MSFDNNTTFDFFQFHKGTIKATREYVKICFFAFFQFHKGTIKAEAHREHRALLRAFNSIKVQLRPCMNYCAHSRPYDFQFHKGTIKACVLWNP